MRCADFAAVKVESYSSKATVVTNRRAQLKSVGPTLRASTAQRAAR